MSSVDSTHTAVRANALNERHRQLGSDQKTLFWNMPIPQSYSTDPYEETTAVRTRAGLFDVSALNIVNVTGKDALSVLDGLVSCDVTKLKPGSARLGAIVNPAGGLVDDIMIICDGPERYRISHGGGDTRTVLAEVCAGKDVTVESDDDVHILSLQGPSALDILGDKTDIDLAALPYFRHEPGKLFGRDVLISRGGYSGEQGYEVYCSSKDAVQIWDAIMEAGRPHGIMAASWDCLDIIRVEAALLFYPFDMLLENTTPWEVNMWWAVDLDKKADYHGKDVILAAKGNERMKIVGLECWHHDAVEAEAKIYKDGKEVGVVTSPAFSKHLMKSLTLALLDPSLTEIGTQVEIRGPSVQCSARVAKTPFYDPMRLRTHPPKDAG